MLKRLIGALLGVALFGGTAMAQCTSGLVPLVNGTTADANAVMGNFNALNGCAAPVANPAFTGNVGIGTTSPGATLDVQAPTASQRIYSTVAGNQAIQTLFTQESPAHTDYYSNYGGILHVGIEGVSGYQMFTNLNAQTGFLWQQFGPSIQFAFGNTPTPEIAMTILSDGAIGIGTATPGYTLQVNGSAAGSGAWINLSDERLKTNIAPISDALGLITRLRGVRYRWRPAEERGIGQELTLPDGPQIGFVAQEVAAVVPEAVAVPAKGSNAPYGLKSADLIPLLVEAVKQQQAEIEQLRASLAALKAGKSGGH